MKIDRMTENQLEAVAQLEQRCFSHPWSFNSLEEELNNETSLFFTATEDNAVVGYIGMSVVVDEVTFSMLPLTVHTEIGE